MVSTSTKITKMDYIVKAYKDWKLHSQFQEIVPEMDDEYMFNEKQSIRDSARSLKKYGSTCCNHIRNETLIRHDIEKTDTLQGIALKYGCTTEQIRRVNRLFASDSLFLRQFLLVPVEKSSPYYPTIIEENKTNSQKFAAESTIQISPISETNGTTTTLAPTTSTSRTTIPSTSSDHALNDANRPTTLPTRPYSIAGELSMLHSNTDGSVLNNQTGVGGRGMMNQCNAASSSKQSKSLDSVVTTVMTPEEENRKCINDFLNKIDNTISESRKYVEKSKEMIASQSDDVLFITTDVVQRPRRSNLNNSYKNNRQSHQNHIRQSSGSDTAQLLNTTKTRHVQSRLSRLEKQQDEFFEL